MAAALGVEARQKYFDAVCGRVAMQGRAGPHAGRVEVAQAVGRGFRFSP
ncbi:hypothetical protein [Embleya scabrispora]|nr:hypothetical protein [Embleya scabrispora]MYS84843.1 hypothetical protein [Streptomyces sp. SID5474]